MKKIENTKFYSKKIGILPKGCQMCVKGEKLVLFITGICNRHCWYCPLSDKRKNKDTIFLNEWKTNNVDDLIEEIQLCQSKGAGITGGDPLIKLNRTLKYIKILKNTFGKNFHIHLYTSLDLVNKNTLKKLHYSGLDEIRFHIDLDNNTYWEKLDIANEFNWDIGIEIPCIPNKEKEIKKLCDYFDKKIDFLNLNEFEISDLNSEKMYENGFYEKSDISYGIKGSKIIADKILEYCKNKNFNVHFCSSKLKDKIQMQNRFKLRAENIKTKFDIITDEGLLIRGCIYLKNYNVYNLKNKKYNKKDIIKNLEIKNKFLEKEGLETIIDYKKLRIITYPEHIRQFSKILKSIKLIPAIIEEDPTVEAFEVNIEYL